MQEILPVLKNIFLYMINLLNDDPTKYFALFFGIPVGIMGLLMYGWIIVKAHKEKPIGFIPAEKEKRKEFLVS